MLTEPAWNTSKAREQLAEMAFEGEKVPALYFGSAGVLSACVSLPLSEIQPNSSSAHTNLRGGKLTGKALQLANLQLWCWTSGMPIAVLCPWWMAMLFALVRLCYTDDPGTDSPVLFICHGVTHKDVRVADIQAQSANPSPRS